MITKGRKGSKNVVDGRSRPYASTQVKMSNHAAARKSVEQYYDNENFDRTHPVSKKVGNSMENAAYQDARRLRAKQRSRAGGVIKMAQVDRFTKAIKTLKLNRTSREKK